MDIKVKPAGNISVFGVSFLLVFEFLLLARTGTILLHVQVLNARWKNLPSFANILLHGLLLKLKLREAFTVKCAAYCYVNLIS